MLRCQGLFYCLRFSNKLNKPLTLDTILVRMVSHKQRSRYLIRSKRYKIAKFISAVLDMLIETKTFNKLKRKYKEKDGDKRDE